MRHSKSVQDPPDNESISDLGEKEIIIHSKVQVGGGLDMHRRRRGYFPIVNLPVRCILGVCIG